MGYFLTEAVGSAGVGNQKSRGELFSGGRRPKPCLRADKRPARQGFRVVASATRTPGVRYYGYRYYNPELGRWVNRDPIEERGFTVAYDIGRSRDVLTIGNINRLSREIPLQMNLLQNSFLDYAEDTVAMSRITGLLIDLRKLSPELADYWRHAPRERTGSLVSRLAVLREALATASLKYTYCANNPAGKVDMLGLYSLRCDPSDCRGTCVININDTADARHYIYGNCILRPNIGRIRGCPMCHCE